MAESETRLWWSRAHGAGRALIEDARTAAAFLTRLPIGPAEDTTIPSRPSGGFLVRAMAMFPIVGAAIGSGAGVTYAAAVGAGLPALVAALVALAVIAVVTGVLHEDGLADCCDGLGAAGSPEKRLRAMKDSHIGTFGALALILSIGMRAALIAAIASPPDVIAGLTVAGAVSRAALPAMLFHVAPARGDGLAVAAGRPSLTCVAVAGSLSVAISFLLLPMLSAIGVVATATCLIVALAALSRRLFSGMTGDVLGAVQQLTEVAALMVIVALR